MTSRYSVLVVDDDPAVLRSIEAILSFDFDVVACAAPAEALRQFDTRRFHVVCSDYVMPGMDGRKLLSEIVRRSDTVCCLLMTARVDIEGSDREFPVVFKPFDSERFVHTVAHLARIAEMKHSTRAMSEAAGSVPGRGTKP
jgi:DNA-binding NtrC family response regulator